MILPLADALQNCLQNLTSRIAGIDNEQMTNRVMGMGAMLGFGATAIKEQFKVSFARALMDEYEITKECAAYVTTEVLENGKDFDKTLDEAIQILDDEKQKEEKGTIIKGSAEKSAAKYYTDKLNPKQEELEEELGREDPRKH